MKFFINTIVALSVLNFFNLVSSAQTLIEQQEAFSSSYEHEKERKYQSAIDDILKIYDASSYEINLRLGWLYQQFGDCVKSLEHYEAALEIMPYSIEARFGMALPLSSMGLWERVIEVYHEALKQDPQNSIANFKLGSIYYKRAEYDAAKRYVEKVVNMYPYDYDSVILLAWINLAMKDYRKARILFEKSLLTKPYNESATEGLELMNPVIK